MANHQHFDVIRCKLCDKIYDDPRLLSCLHSFCRQCLENYVTENATESNTCITCPLCEEITSISSCMLSPDLKSGDSLQELMKNFLLERLITQAQREQTKVVAEQEVLKIQAEALTEDELRSEDIQKTILRIANTAGEVIAHETEDQSRVHDFETIKQRQDLQKKIMTLQEKALDIVYAIDEVNLGIQEWDVRKNHLRDAIKQRSQNLQNIIQATERKLLAKVEDKNAETDVKDTGYEAKSKLHKTLKGTLNIVDFLKLLTEYGDKANLETYHKVADERISDYMKKNIEMKHTDLTFESPKVDLSEAIELMFGSLTEIDEMKTVWNPLESKRPTDNITKEDSSPNSDVESHLVETSDYGIRQEAFLAPRYAEINESNIDTVVEDESIAQSSSALKHGRRPLKSMSFDESSFGFLHQPHMTTSHSHFINRSSEVNEIDQSEIKYNDDRAPAHHPVIPQENDTRSISNYISYPMNYSRGRRSSAPPSMIIDALAKRRLNALSILERSNINTQGMGVPSFAEMGLNRARLEWMRENVKRKNEGLRRSSIQENV